MLEERGIPFDCFEKGSDIGGLWRYENDNALASAYACLYINTSRQTAQYASRPMADDYPDFPHHTQMLAYLEDYVEHFGFRDRIRFRTEVTTSSPVDDAWEVTWREAGGAARSERYTAVLVANGHHWDPRPLNPRPPGLVRGHRRSTPTTTARRRSLADKRVLVVGIGDSAMDIACDTSQVSKMTFLTARRGAGSYPNISGAFRWGRSASNAKSQVPIASEVATGALFSLGSAPVRAENRP